MKVHQGRATCEYRGVANELRTQKKKKSGDTTVDVDQVQKLFTGVRAINGSSAYLKNSMSLNE